MRRIVLTRNHSHTIKTDFTFFRHCFQRLQTRNFLQFLMQCVTIPKICTKPNPKLFSIPKFSDTESNTFADNKYFQYRIRYFFRDQIFVIPNPKPSKNEKSFETEKFRNRNITQNTQNLNETEPNRIHVSSVHLLGLFCTPKVENFTS